VSLAQGRHSGLFEESLPYGFGPEAVAALGRRVAPFAALLELVDPETIVLRSDDPYFLAIAGRPSEELQRKAKALVTEGKEVVARHALLAAGPVFSESDPPGAFERTWFPLVETEAPASSDDAETPFRVLRSAEVEPFANAVPLYDDLETVAARFADERSAEDAPQVASRGRPEAALQADELENPADYTWVAYEGRTVPRSGLFVARAAGEAMDRRIPSGAWCVFRLAPSSPRDGQTVLAVHRGAAVLRIYESEMETVDDDSWRPIVVLRPASTDPSFQPIVVRDPEEEGFRIVAELVEVLG
jgi:hypothetical protein